MIRGLLVGLLFASLLFGTLLISGVIALMLCMRWAAWEVVVAACMADLNNAVSA